ncbi:unnamed protein product [Blepharisma stoltei]|uniref:Disease resistance R13L4/SHOC-2-like LRR domain-containing protein n=1 Tax=Blepharisma stoltei TaxID=1481888 RepID=A0AAU9K577_9CILI|nr:unnamed protein product [Blepharisma stoltei]
MSKPLSNVGTLLTPTGELILKESSLSTLNKELFEGSWDRILHLDLRGNEITNLHKSPIFHLTHLRSLDLRGNKLDILTEEISAFQYLKTLTLDSNHLSTLPIELFSLTSLTSLSFSNNSLFCLPKEIINLKKLESLVISDNQIKALPTEIGQLKHLQVLYLHGNDYSALPVSMARLEQLTELSLEWFRYTFPPLPRILKGHIGEAMIGSLRCLFQKLAKKKHQECDLAHFLKHFSQDEFDINRVDARNRSLLHIAASNGDCGVIQGLIDAGVEINTLDSEGFSPLVLALKSDKIGASKLLLESGISVNEGGGNIGSPMHLAVYKAEAWLVRALLKAGADVNSRDCDGNTPLHILMGVFGKHKRKCTLIADMLLESGIEVNAVNYENWTALHMAARRGHSSAIFWAINQNSKLRKENKEPFDINIVGGSQEWTPLHLASHSGHFKAVQALIEGGCEVYIKNKEGKTPKETSKGDLAVYKFIAQAEKEQLKKQVMANSKEEISAEVTENEEKGDYEIAADCTFPLWRRYECLYKLYQEGYSKELENLISELEDGILKVDAIHLYGQTKNRKSSKLFREIIKNKQNMELVRNEAGYEREEMRGIESKVSHVQSLIGPKLLKTNPLQMSLPVNLSILMEEETRKDSLLII